MPSYDEVLADGHVTDYAAYQGRYIDEPRESDKTLIRHVAAAVEGIDRPRILDIGCSTGNLLRHLRAALPDADLAGGDISTTHLEQARQDPTLDGVRFEVMDATAIEGEWDVVTAAATLCVMAWPDYEKALGSIADHLAPGGRLITFDWYQPHPHDLDIVETSRSHPNGITLYFRSTHTVEPMLRAAGFEQIRFRPFRIPIDLDGAPVGENTSGYEDLNSRTVNTATGDRLIFRGVLAQPWCHLVARR